MVVEDETALGAMVQGAEEAQVIAATAAMMTGVEAEAEEEEEEEVETGDENCIFYWDRKSGVGTEIQEFYLIPMRLALHVASIKPGNKAHGMRNRVPKGFEEGEKCEKGNRDYRRTLGSCLQKRMLLRSLLLSNDAVFPVTNSAYIKSFRTIPSLLS